MCERCRRSFIAGPAPANRRMTSDMGISEHRPGSAAGFVLSLDLELMWGVRASQSIETYGANVLGVRRAVPRLRPKSPERRPTPPCVRRAETNSAVGHHVLLSYRKFREASWDNVQAWYRFSDVRNTPRLIPGKGETACMNWAPW